MNTHHRLILPPSPATQRRCVCAPLTCNPPATATVASPSPAPLLPPSPPRPPAVVILLPAVVLLRPDAYLTAQYIVMVLQFTVYYVFMASLFVMFR